jgi:hypothetical protein
VVCVLVPLRGCEHERERDPIWRMRGSNSDPPLISA